MSKRDAALPLRVRDRQSARIVPYRTETVGRSRMRSCRPSLSLGTTRGSDEPAATRAGCFRFDPAEQDRALALGI